MYPPKLLRYTLQDKATTGDGIAVEVSHAAGLGGVGETVREHIFYVKGNGSVSAGEVTLETAASAEETGKWSAITAAVSVPANETTAVSLRGVFLAVRARISTAVASGTVSVVYAGG